jgi:branched-chain amino acid transport system substrate-binding protein
VVEGVRQALGRRGIKPVAEGIFERNTLAVKTALLKIQRGDPEAVILLGMYKPCAEFIKLARQYKLNALLAMGSYNGANAFLEEAGPAASGVIATQVVPPPDDLKFPAAADFQAALKVVEPLEKPGFLSFQGYLAGRLAIAALEKSPAELSRRVFLDTIFQSTFDLGGVVYSFAPDNNQGSHRVYMTVIQPDGTYKTVPDLRAVANAW